MQQCELDAQYLFKRNHGDHTNNENHDDCENSNVNDRSVLVTSSKQQHSEWKLTIKDGQLRLHTKVETIEDLLQYSDAFIKHLSPFESVFRKPWIQLESTSHRLVLCVFNAIFLLDKAKQESNLKEKPSLHYSPMVVIEHTRSLFLNIHYRSMINHLINSYTNHHTSRRLFLHTPTFIEHYNNLQDPLTCSITLAASIHTLCIARRIITDSATERREIANFFYKRCQEMLYDMFDDPTRKFETVIVINLLQYFTMFVLLRFTEARRWATIACSLCKDLESGNIEREKDKAEAIPVIRLLTSRVRRVLLKRHSSYAENTLHLLDIMIEGKMFRADSATLGMTVIFMEPMPGEDEGSRDLVEAHNRLLELCTCPYMAAITSHIDTLDSSLSSNHEVTLDILERLDTAIQEWWSDLPIYLRLCDDLYEMDLNDVLENNESAPKAIIFSFIQSILFKIYGCVLDIKRRSTGLQERSSENNSHDKNNSLYHRATLHAAERSCEHLLSTIIRMFTLQQDMLPFMFEFISRAIYAVLNISYFSNNHGISSGLRDKFIECFDTIRNVFPPDNIVPQSKSPLDIYYKTHELGDVSIYQNYSLPGIALVADIVNSGYTFVKSNLLQQPFQEPLYNHLKIYGQSALYGNFCLME
ncbi:hypothetical protein BDC45DRAFT_293739 [Circinella umbellata]|nr:hypothetical protein BDC45DRAFT_293739 [Circinella umbellata]